MPDIPITLTPEEIAAWPVPVIVRVAEECAHCVAGLVHETTYIGQPTAMTRTCSNCNGTGYADPYAAGDVLVVHIMTPCLARDCGFLIGTRRAAIEDVRLVRLQDTTEDEARQRVEANDDDGVTYYGPYGKGHASALVAYRKDWDRNNPDRPWSSNPMVRVVSLRPVEES